MPKNRCLACVSHWASQRASSEIIVVDSSSSDRTVEIAEAFGARVFIVPAEDFDHGGTRTLAGKAAKGDILVYMTQDAAPFDEHSIENIIGPLEDQEIAASFGRQLPYPNASAFGAHLRLFNYPDSSCIKAWGTEIRMASRQRFCQTPLQHTARPPWKKSAGFKEG